MATRLELEQEAGRRASAKRQVIAMGATPEPAVVVSDAPMPTDEVVEELTRQVPKRTRNRKAKDEVEAAPEATPEPEAPAADLDEIDALLDL